MQIPYEALYIKYLKLGTKEFNLEFKHLKKYIKQKEGLFNSNAEMAVKCILAGNMYSTFKYIIESGDLITGRSLSKLLTSEVNKEKNEQVFFRIKNLLFYINYLKFRLEIKLVEKTKKQCNKKEILYLIKKNQEIKEKEDEAQKCFKKGYYHSAYIYYKYAGKLSPNILDKIINKLIDKKQINNLAYILDAENRALPKNLFKKFGNFAMEKEHMSAFFYFYKLNSKKDFIKAIKYIFPRLVK